jgi:acyl-CoA reductase-like NAD-dependent aldehyde dehydrogenase
MYQLKNYINGQWVQAESGKTARSVNPANWDEEVSEYPLAGQVDAQKAIAAAAAAQPRWGTLPPPQRGAILDKASQIIDARVDEMTRALTLEEGKTLAESKLEVLRTRDIFKYFGGEGWRVGGTVLPSNTPNELLYTRREPLGVELSHCHPGLEDRSGAGLRQCSGVQTGLPDPLDRQYVGRGAGRSRLAARGAQLYHRARGRDR